MTNSMKPLAQRLLRTTTVAVALGLFVVAPISRARAQEAESAPATSDVSREIERLLARYADGWTRNNVGQALSVFARDYKDATFDYRGLKQEFNTFLKQIRDVSLSLELEAVRPIDEERVVAFTIGSLEFTDRADNRRYSAPLNKVLFLRHERAGWRIFSRLDYDPAKQLAVDGGAFRSEYTNFQFQIPPDWLLVAQPMDCCGCDEHLIALSPDLDARIAVYALTLPIELTAQQAVLAETPRESVLSDRRLVSSRGVSGHQVELEHRTKNNRHRIAKSYFLQGRRCYAFIYDHRDRKTFDRYRPTYDLVVSGFDVLSPQKPHSPLLRIADGEINNQIYTSERLGLQVAAPPGWTLDLAGSQPDFPRLTMRNDSGQSTVQFIASPAREGQTLEQLADETLAALEDRAGLTTGRAAKRNTKLDGSLRAREVLLDLEIAQIGQLRRRAVFCIDGDQQYVFLCDAIPASEYSRVEKDFDTIIQSLTRN